MLPSDSSAVLNPPIPAKRSMKVVSASGVVFTGITVAVLMVVEIFIVLYVAA